MGIKSDTGLGSNVDELNAAANFYLNTVVQPLQNHILNTLQTIFSVNNIDLPVSFVQLKPITVEFTSEDLKAVMTEQEIREELGLKPIADVEVREDFSKVGMIDGKPVFNTIEEAIKNAKALGCEGYHEHELEGKTVYMACEGHTEATELNKFIKEFGEDKPEEWELVDEEIVDGEHQDFDFEQVLNEVANDKLELASTGTARPNTRSSQDGVNKSYNEFYKVRYVYTKDNFLSQEGSTRDFCSIMTSADKIYRKEDIIQMGSRAVNAGWGPKGAATYSIWLYKGGGNCHHFWLRKIYKTSLRNAKAPISDSQIIGYTKARSEGFTAEQNNTLVAKPPKRMKNNGFLEPR